MKLVFCRVTNSDDPLFSEAWSLYEQAFPIMERREQELQCQLLGEERYHFDVVKSGTEMVGFIMWWHFDRLVYIEHLATHQPVRGRGIGEQIVKALLNETGAKVVLEVEPPVSDMNRRRIGFYERLGFQLNHYPYQQLPLRRNGKSVELLLMSSPGSITESELAAFKEQFQKYCYSPFLSYL
ncbi:GNAT family N-acetyltransferase [Carboxylicivirga sediminis]|uniref:GNAT family N-acetyltransferase n=1 Tax=Carboxylicivirga sediminis TaxID=2006564 RepID=A0A941IYR8_9BACT|nr:GNAT family N-acetyltransferase [Carboxylicivirga sediminis]MBR8536878.1 GNAT family N-acetyltransferase [Carboxylicivirga sediminis]